MQTKLQICFGFISDCCLTAAFCALAVVMAAAHANGGNTQREAGGAESTPTVSVEVDIEFQLLTLQAENARLDELLYTIAEAGSFKVELDGDFSTLINHSMVDEPLEGAIGHLIGSHHLTIYHRQVASEPERTTIAEIHVVERTEEPLNYDDGSEGSLSDRAAEQNITERADEPIDRASFREAHFGRTPANREDVLVDLDDPEQAVRAAAVPKVGTLLPRDALKILAQLFTSESDSLVRSRAVAALAKLDHPRVRSLLRDLALQDDDSSLRAQAIHAIAAKEGDRSVTILKRHSSLTQMPMSASRPCKGFRNLAQSGRAMPLVERSVIRTQGLLLLQKQH